MNNRQKIFLALTIALISVLIFASIFISAQNQNENKKLKVVTTFYPLTFFVEQIGAEKITLQQLIPYNTEVHSWSPSPSEILAVESADYIFYNGASLDHLFEEDILTIINTSNKLIVETSEGIAILENQHHQKEHDEEHEGLYDPHTWISPFIAKQQAKKVYEALIQKDPNNTDYYSENWVDLEKKFEELDTEYIIELSNKNKTKIFVSHSAYGYLASRYSFEQHGIVGISADEQPNFSVYKNIVDLMIENEIYTLYINPVYSVESIQTLKNELEQLSGQPVKILELYLMLGDLDGLDFFGQQEENLKNLKIGFEA